MPRKNWLFTLVLILLITLSLAVLIPAYTQYRASRASLYEMKERLCRQEAELAALKKKVAALRTDYRAVERAARERLGLCREDEEIYHFETPRQNDKSEAETNAPESARKR